MSLPEYPIPRAPLDPLSADQQFNRFATAVRTLQRSVAERTRSRGQVNPQGLVTGFVTDILLGYTTETPPPGGDTYSNARYWIVRAIPLRGLDYGKNGIVTDNLVVESHPFNGLLPQVPTLTATNLCEQFQQPSDGEAPFEKGTHLLAEFTQVVCFGIASMKNPAVKTYVFMTPPKLAVSVRIATTATGKGKYFGHIVKAPTDDISDSTDLTDSELGVDGEDVLIVNALEANKSTGPAHDITPADYPRTWPGVLIYVNEDGTKVVEINGPQREDCAA